MGPPAGPNPWRSCGVALLTRAGYRLAMWATLVLLMGCLVDNPSGDRCTYPPACMGESPCDKGSSEPDANRECAGSEVVVTCGWNAGVEGGTTEVCADSAALEAIEAECASHTEEGCTFSASGSGFEVECGNARCG